MILLPLDLKGMSAELPEKVQHRQRLVLPPQSAGASYSVLATRDANFTKASSAKTCFRREAFFTQGIFHPRAEEPRKALQERVLETKALRIETSPNC